MKKLMITIGVILVILISWIAYNSTKIRLYEGLDVESIAEIHISNIGTRLDTNDKSKILKITNYLKNLKLSKRTDTKVPNESRDTSIELEDKNGKVISRIELYGYVLIIHPDEEYYTTPTSMYSDLEKMCKEYK